MLRPLYLCLLALGLCAGYVAAIVPGRATAGTAVELDVADLVDASDLLIEARVLAAQGVEDPRGIICTDLDLQVQRTFWGEQRTLRRVRVPGGVLDDGRGMVLPGVSIPPVGSTCLLFLSAPGVDGLRMPVGLAQGARQIVAEPGRAPMAVQDEQHLRFATPGGASRSGRGVVATDYAELVAEIEASVESRIQRSGGGR